jgi:hypothetical protein
MSTGPAQQIHEQGEVVDGGRVPAGPIPVGTLLRLGPDGRQRVTSPVELDPRQLGATRVVAYDWGARPDQSVAMVVLEVAPGQPPRLVRS